MKKIEQCHNLYDYDGRNHDFDTEYSTHLAMMIARVIHDINSKVTVHGACFSQQYILQRGLHKFKEAGMEAAKKEVDQLHRRSCYTPLDVSELTPEEKNKAMMALMFLTEKRDKSIKGRLCYNGKPTRQWLSRDETASPTAAL